MTSILQNMNVDPVKEMAAEIAAEETTPTTPEPTAKQVNQQERIADFDAEQAKEEAAAPEADATPAEAKEEGAEEEAEPKLVPVKAVAEARRLARQWEEKAREYERHLAQQEGYQRALAEQQQQPEEQPPDPETDPIGALKWVQKRNSELEQQLYEQRYTQQQQVQLEQFKQRYATDVRSFVQTKPEAAQAYQYLFNNRVQELVALGQEPNEAHAQVMSEEINLAASAYQRGQHPAEVILSLAQQRGFQAKAPEPPKPDLAKQVENAKAKTNAATGVAKGGSAPKTDVRPEDLLHLEGAAFDAAWEKLARQSKGRALSFR